MDAPKIENQTEQPQRPHRETVNHIINNNKTGTNPLDYLDVKAGGRWRWTLKAITSVCWSTCRNNRSILETRVFTFENIISLKGAR